MLRRFFTCLLLVSVLVTWGCSSTDPRPPRAQHGVIDLTGWNFTSHGAVDLNGEWAFFWHHLVAPNELQHEETGQTPLFVSLPGSWNRLKPRGFIQDRNGYATFSLQVMLGGSSHDLALHLGNIRSAYRLWINGQLRAESGTVATDSSSEVPGHQVHLVRLPQNVDTVNLVLQVSNFHYREGGIISPIRLGPAGMLHAQQFRQWGIALLCIGSLLVIGLYHIVLFCLRRQDVAPLYFGTYCLLWMGYSLISYSSGWVITLFSGPLPIWLLNRVDLICLILSVPVGYSFFCTLYRDECSNILRKAVWGIATVFVLAGISTSTFTFSSVMPLYFLVSVVMILSSIFMLAKAARKGREGALFILIGFTVLGCIGINDMLYSLQLIRSLYLIHVGAFIFMLFQAFALSQRLSSAFSAVEELSDQLSNKNLELEMEIAERSRLQHEVVHVAEAARRRISHELHDGLCQQLTGARLRCLVLERKLNGLSDYQADLIQLSALLEEAVNQAYTLSRGLWPQDPEENDMTRSLEALVHKMSQSSGMAIEFERTSRCDQIVYADTAKLCRIAQEAITNAIKHARATRIVVALRCQHDRQITLTVRDNGIGISPTPGTEGGLGMSIMSHRARLLGGSLSVHVAEGGGTLVTCVVPCFKDTPEEQP